jgi:hypothetical protein
MEYPEDNGKPRKKKNAAKGIPWLRAHHNSREHEAD